LTTLPVALDDSMTFAAWDKLSLDKLCVAWYFAMAKQPMKRFPIPVKIGTEVLSTYGFINDPKTVMFSDASMQANEGRLHAVTYAIQVNAQVIAGEEITPLTEIEVWGITEAYIRHGGDV